MCELREGVFYLPQYLLGSVLIFSGGNEANVNFQLGFGSFALQRLGGALFAALRPGFLLLLFARGRRHGSQKARTHSFVQLFHRLGEAFAAPHFLGERKAFFLQPAFGRADQNLERRALADLAETREGVRNFLQRVGLKLAVGQDRKHGIFVQRQ